MKLTLLEIKELTFELFGMMVTNQETKENVVITNGLLKNELDLKSKYFLTRFAKSVSEMLPSEDEETSNDLWQTEHDISNLIINFPKDLADKVGEVKTKESYPVLMKVLMEKD